MTTAIRTWADSDFYISSAGTTNVREQIIKLQSIAKLVRALSDASTVDTNGDKLQDRLLGLSLGDLTQRHKWRVLYDNLNDRFLVQRNTGTDASKVWVERLRLDASGSLTVSGDLNQALIDTSSGKVALSADLDVNGFYIRNVDNLSASTIRVTGPATFQNSHSIGWVYIGQKTASNAQFIDFTGLNQYPKYRIEIEQMRPSADNAIPLMQLSTTNGATYISTGVYNTAGLGNSNFGSGVQQQISTSAVGAWQLIGDGDIGQDNASGAAITGTVSLNSMGTASLQARARAQLEWVESSGLFLVTTDIGMTALTLGTVNAVRISYFSGVIASGTFRLYGMRDS